MSCASQVSYPRKSTLREEGAKLRVHREVLSKSVRLMSVVLERRNSGEYHMRRSWPENDAPAKLRGICRKLFTSSGIWTKLRFMFSGEVKGMSTPVTSKRPEERELVVDSGASMHMMSKKKNLSSEEMDTLRRCRTPTGYWLLVEKCTPMRRHQYSLMIQM